MNPYGGYKIYMIDIFGSFGATLAAYLLGVLLVITLGMQIGAVFNKSVSKIHIEALEKALFGLSEEISDGEDGESDEDSKNNEDSETVNTESDGEEKNEAYSN